MLYTYVLQYVSSLYVYMYKLSHLFHVLSVINHVELVKHILHLLENQHNINQSSIEHKTCKSVLRRI